MSEAAAGALCTNCGDAGARAFCASCGERQPHHHDLTVGHFLHDVFHELVHLDSKLFRTLRMLATRPGLLTADYFDGRKTRYIGPLRLFIVLFAVQFFLYALSPRTHVFDITAIEQSRPDVKQTIDRMAAKRNLPPAEVRAKINQQWTKAFKFLELVQIVLAGAFIGLFYRNRYFVEHLVFSAHFLAFTYLYAIAMYPVRWQIGMLTPAGRTASWIGGAILATYLALAMRRFYEHGRRLPWVRAVVAYAGVLLVFGLLQGGTAAFALVMALKR